MLEGGTLLLFSSDKGGFPFSSVKLVNLFSEYICHLKKQGSLSLLYLIIVFLYLLMCKFKGPKITKQRDWNKEKYNIKDIILPKLLEW